MNPKHRLFHPLTIIGVSLACAALFTAAASMIPIPMVRSFLLYYYAPVVVPCVAFILDRAEKRKEPIVTQWIIDGAVILLAVARLVYVIPFISGHALFLTYSVLTSKSWVARISAVMVLLQVVYLKIFVWHDLTLLGGAAVGCLAGLLHRKFAREQSPDGH